ncbi:hypothetical protein [Halarcobacter bivalviorum]|uniref:hypothetical protein n=1 Tax=Halarcobacter bivalviorum TaxID=663364 RepID=UPI00100A7333|nr:hypothetical protein [Halarcobacter bivalviorum]
MADLMLKAVSLNCDNLHIMLSYSGHVNNVSIYIYYGGWKEENSKSTEIRCKTDDEFEITKAYIQLTKASRLWKKHKKMTFFDYQNKIEKIV